MDHMPTQLLQMQFTPRSTVTEVMKTMVVGGLQSLQTLDAATQWSNAKLKTLTGPCQQGTYIKSQQFQACCLPSSLLHWSVTLQWRCYDVLFFFSKHLVAAWTRSSGCSDSWQCLCWPAPRCVDNVYTGLFRGWRNPYGPVISFCGSSVKQGLGEQLPHGWGAPSLTHSRKMFLIGWMSQLTQSGFMKHELSIDENFRSVLVGGQKVINMATENGNVVYTWSPQWDAWNDIQHSEEMQLLKDRASGRGVVERKKMIRRREL